MPKFLTTKGTKVLKGNRQRVLFVWFAPFVVADYLPAPRISLLSSCATAG
jgi:hypothetical protein